MPVEPPIQPTVPPPETTPAPQPGQPAAPPPEIHPPVPDIDVPNPQPGTDPGIAPGQPMPEHTRFEVEKIATEHSNDLDIAARPALMMSTKRRHFYSPSHPGGR